MAGRKRRPRWGNPPWNTSRYKIRVLKEVTESDLKGSDLWIGALEVRYLVRYWLDVVLKTDPAKPHRFEHTPAVCKARAYACLRLDALLRTGVISRQEFRDMVEQKKAEYSIGFLGSGEETKQSEEDESDELWGLV